MDFHVFTLDSRILAKLLTNSPDFDFDGYGNSANDCQILFRWPSAFLLIRWTEGCQGWTERAECCSILVGNCNSSIVSAQPRLSKTSASSSTYNTCWERCTHLLEKYVLIDKLVFITSSRAVSSPHLVQHSGIKASELALQNPEAIDARDYTTKM